jgi:hypothetical protein
MSEMIHWRSLRPHLTIDDKQAYRQLFRFDRARTVLAIANYSALQHYFQTAKPSSPP